MVWATRCVASDLVRSIEDLFREQAAAFDRDGQMLLVSLHQEGATVRLWVGLPDDDLLEPYYGFVPCRRLDLPLAPALVAGDVSRFQQLFQSV